MSDALAALRGRINDLDSHLQVPASRWGEVFGEVGERLGAKLVGARFFDETDVPPLTEDTVWTTKGTNAPGAATPHERLAALDVMGIDRQLIFPQVVMAVPAWREGPRAAEVRRAYNDAVVAWTSAGRGRLRPTALLSTHDLDEAVAEAERVIGQGVRAVLLQDGTPTGGRSPASDEADRLWAVLAEADIAALLHIGGQQGFLGSEAWADTPLLQADRAGHGEAIGPHLLGTMQLSPMNYLTTMIFGGVFERHPGLRFGVIELGAYWVGPFADLLDNRVESSRRLRERLSLRPSETLARNVRVTPFFWEPIGRQIERYGLPEVYAFSTDFPHPEGGTDPIGSMYADVAPLGDDVVERFFVTNAELLVPA